jgi:hypothetical protein
MAVAPPAETASCGAARTLQDTPALRCVWLCRIAVVLEAASLLGAALLGSGGRRGAFGALRAAESHEGVAERAAARRAAAGLLRRAEAGSGVGSKHAVALLLCLAALPARALSPPPPGVSTSACGVSSWMYVAGFSGGSSWLNGFYAPYYNATLAPAALRPCTNAGPYGASGTGAPWAGAFDATWQSAGHPVGYYNVGSGVGNASNGFWVRDFKNPLFGDTKSYWNLVLGERANAWRRVATTEHASEPESARTQALRTASP